MYSLGMDTGWSKGALDPSPSNKLLAYQDFFGLTLPDSAVPQFILTPFP